MSLPDPGPLEMQDGTGSCARTKGFHAGGTGRCIRIMAPSGILTAVKVILDAHLQLYNKSDVRPIWSTHMEIAEEPEADKVVANEPEEDRTVEVVVSESEESVPKDYEKEREMLLSAARRMRILFFWKNHSLFTCVAAEQRLLKKRKFI